MADFRFQEMFELGEDSAPYRKLSDQHVSTVREKLKQAADLTR